MVTGMQYQDFISDMIMENIKISNQFSIVYSCNCVKWMISMNMCQIKFMNCIELIISLENLVDKV